MKSVKDWEQQQIINTPRPQEQVISLLTEHLEQISDLQSQKEGTSSAAFEEWQSSVDTILRRTFGEESQERNRFDEISYTPSIVTIGGDNTEVYDEAYLRGLDKASGQIKSVIKMLQSMGMPSSQPVIKKSGTNISVNPVFNQNQTNNMQQEQHQTVNITLEQAIDNALSYVRQNHTDETIKEAEAIVAPLKQKDVAWSYVQKAIMFFLGLGRDAFFSFAPVLYQMAMTTPH